MTTTINFDSMPQVRKAAANKPDAGTNWYSHEDRKYECLYLGVGKRASTWYFKGRLNGKSVQKSLGKTFPGTTAAQAKVAMEELTDRTGTTQSAQIKTVRDAWENHCTTAKANKGTSDRSLNDLTRKLERWAPEIMNADHRLVDRTMIQNAINAIDTQRGDNSAATKRHVKAALSAAFKVAGHNPVEGVVVPEANERDPIWYDLCDEYRFLDPDDWSYVWQAIWNERERHILKGTAWIVMLFTGIRAGNVASLRWERDGEHGWVDLQRKSITFPKLKSGAKNREVPLCDTVVNALLAIRGRCEDWVFPADTATGHIRSDGFGRIKADVPDVGIVDVANPHCTRGFFQDAANEAGLAEHLMNFLRGDKTTRGKDRRSDTAKMLMKYTTRVGKSAPTMIETVICEQIKVEPSFED